ncbi:MAG TPA: hypothetical protein VFV37_11120 [Luteibaculaceae bacterium]|nr:hypothetical protein [Luteibaculaceae bacterium]
MNNNLAAKSIFYSYIVNNTPILLNGGSGTNETVATTASSISALRTRAAAVYGGSPADYFPNCYVGPNPFNETDPAMIESVDGDHTLNSIMGAGLMAATMADNFGFVGAYNIATRWGVGDFTTLTNLSIVGNDYQLTNPLSDGSAIGKIKSFGRIRDIQRNLFSGSEAPLNGIVLDSTQDQGAPIAPSGTTYSGLLNPASYVVSQGAGVTYNGIVYTQGQKFTTVAGVTTATDNDGLGRIREIIERPNKKNVQWRFSQGGAVSSNINTFTNNSWLTVLQGSINDGTFTYNVGDFLLYNNALTYSGTYSLQFVFLESEPFKNFEISNANNFSVDGSGTANGEQAFNYGTEVSFRARYGQPKLIIEADNQRFLI